MTNRFTSLLIVAALSLNSPPFSKQAVILLSDSTVILTKFGRPPDSLSDAGCDIALDFQQSQANQNPPGQTRQTGQDHPIRVKTELIDLRAVVTDKRGQPITDLKKEDFELMENGKPQEVSFFSVVKIPGRGEARRSENSPANGTTGVPAGATRPAETIGRTVVLYIDTLHLSPQSLL